MAHKLDSKSRAKLLTRLLEAQKRNKLSHSLIFESTDQDYLFSQIVDFAKTLLCLNSQDSTACENCSSCQSIRNEESLELTHPDFKILSPDNEKGYSLSYIKESLAFIHLSQALSENKIVLITQADKLLVSASNALLKLIEEPPKNSFLFLSTQNAQSLLPTIKSRCHLYKILNPQKKSAVLEDDLLEWKDFMNYLSAGCPPRKYYRCPADSESFWKERALAIEQIKNIALKSWSLSKKALENLSEESQHRILSTHEFLRDALNNIETYTNPYAQWALLKRYQFEGKLWTQ